MPTIDFGGGVRVRVDAGTTVLEASIARGLDHAHACGGRGRCTTCRVRVEAGQASCPPPADGERQALAINRLEPPIRLACQLVPTGDVAVRILIPVHEAPPRASPDASEEKIAALFCDIRGFTHFAEGHMPFDVCTVLNRYFDLMGVIVESHGGHILDYLGDGIMVIFRPDSSEDPCARAVGCALGMHRASRGFEEYVREHFDAALRIGTAVDTGRAVVGDLGYFRNRHLNAVGDVLNVVARLEDLNKECGTDILITRAVADACGRSLDLGRSFELHVRGRESAVAALELLG